MGKVLHDLTDEQWAALMDAWAGCAYCGSPALALQKDCVLPISRGGRYTLTNVVPACRSCNASSATTRSPAGCAARSSTRGRSWCGTTNS